MASWTRSCHENCPAVVAGEVSQMGMPGCGLSRPERFADAGTNDERLVDQRIHSFADFLKQPAFDVERGILDQVAR